MSTGPQATPSSPQTMDRQTGSQTDDDYPLRYAPSHYRRWSSATVAITALGGIAYLADFSIGASIALSYGTWNAILGILVAAFIIFISGFPLAWYAARYNIDLDLISRGAGFGYGGSILTSLVFASFTCILFALEGSIMAQGLALGLGMPLWAGYLLSTLVVFPFVLYGMKALAKMQVWTTPLWLLLMLGPVSYLVYKQPALVPHFLSFPGLSGHEALSLSAIMLSSGVALALMAQIGEQIDYLRFMPTKTKENRLSWWVSVIAAGPGWVILGALKQIIGAFLAVFILKQVGAHTAAEPVHQFLAALQTIFTPTLAMILAVILVVISQIKINITNAYSGSLAWTSAYTRLTGHFPGRLVFLVINLLLALALMEGNMFSILQAILSLYADCAIAWIMTVTADIVFNKYLLGLSPKEPEFRRTMLPAINPVGTGAFLLATVISILAYEGVLGAGLQPYSALIAFLVASIATPLLALLTRGRTYLLRDDDGIEEPRFHPDGTANTTLHRCISCEGEYERPDMLCLPEQDDTVCSLCAGLKKS
ncbi:allantoin permease [Bombella sp. TMW 2.2543]|uniref:Allantoin permease n=1 Tax=Bombella pluederhausensis TaxID=2967336 RepID=A0ABT3WGD0_9PROT|nr:allantoin permease [Bombella pluederhausensis]MCX5617280.1 allantoin permease [Bombella pluederhausensis]